MDKIVCLGKNYLEHAKELGDEVPEKPVIFLKPPSVLRVAAQGEELLLNFPKDVLAIHFETEVVLRIDGGGYRLSVAEAQKCIGAVAVGLDMTIRERQTEQKKKGHPWTTSKVFPDSAIVGPWSTVEGSEAYLKETFTFACENEIRQQDCAYNMRMSPAECVAYASEFFCLRPGDLIFTGTPAGVGPIHPKQKYCLRYLNTEYFVRWNKN